MTLSSSIMAKLAAGAILAVAALLVPVRVDQSNLGLELSTVCASGSCKPKTNWDCIIDGILRTHKCDVASPGCGPA